LVQAMKEEWQAQVDGLRERLREREEQLAGH
jgi:hypothetical protein